ncbi:MAG: choice-of-anchor D domain-containing protein [Sedimentisphaerales bacterium]|nr:choice-of-anchor D domain-containing protein [Sedimentisphaerales bacterium]
MKRLWKMLKGNRRSQKQQSANTKPIFENLEPRLLLNAVPYIQDFSLGKPDAAAGWDYYSDNEGRIEVVSGRLQMDDTAGNTIYSSNEAILHVDLTGKTDVTLTLDHWSLADENDALPDSFAGHFKGDGIALSVDGQNWVKVTDLTISFTNQSFKLDSALEQAKIAANSTDVSDVQIKFQQYDNYSASTDGRQFDNIKIQSSTVVAQAVPYLQDFGLGKPDAAGGWEYYSDNEGRIQVVSGRLRMDDIAGNTTYSLNEAILHVNLTNTTGVILTLDHLSLADEVDPIIPNSFIGHYKGDGIALSVDGQNWVKVTDLSGNFTNQSFNLDTIIQQAKIAANSTDLSNVRIKFQQYDNYAANTDGREFDNIKVKATLIAPEMDVLGNGQIIVDGDTTPNSIDHTDFGSVYLSSSIVRTFTIMNTGTAALNITSIQRTGSTDFSVIQQPASVVAANGGTTTFKVQFTPTSSGVRTATIQIANNDANENPYNFVIQGTGLVLTTPEIDVLGNGYVIVDGDTTPNAIDYTDFGSIQQGSSTVRTFTIMNTGTAALNITSVQRTGSTDFSVIQQPASVVAANGGTTTFQIQFAPNSTGVHTATIQIANNDSNENPYDFVIQGTGLAIPIVTQAIPYIQTFSSGKPDGSGGWEYYSDNQGRIQVVNGRLRMDDTTIDSIYSLNEAILHVNLTGKTGITLTLDHLSLADEVDTIIPDSFTGHYKGDGIALSVDGQNWVKVTNLSVNFTNQTFNLDTLLQQAKIDAGSTDVSNVRIKFQQYDNQSANTDGREFDNIVVNFGANQAPVISSVTANPSVISDTETSQLQVNAYDPDNGPNVLTYSWTVPSGQGSLNNLNIANPIYTPPDVNATQTFTLTVKVSDGINITSQTVNITVTDTLPVNQAPVITSVTASPSTISDTQTSQLQVTATDFDGPNALTYSWTVPSGQGSLNNYNTANPIYTPPDVSATQIFTLTAKVSDGAAITTKTVDITVTDTVPGPQILLSDDFNDGNYNGWILVDQGTLAGPMAWSAASGVMVQSSNVHSTLAIDPVAKLGTYAYWQAGTGWTDYTAAVTIKSTDNDAIGVMFRYQDENNYYRFIWDAERNSRQLVKCENGVFSILAEDSVPYVTGKEYQVKIAVQGSSLQVSIDGSPVFSVTDSTFSSGTIALYSWGNAGSYFDDIMVST